MNATNAPLRRFQWRSLLTALVALSFVLLLASGTILFLAPPGRVANWTRWAVLGLRKSDWTGLHVWFSVVFLAVVGGHLFFNWRPLLSTLKDRATRRIALRREWIVAAGVVAAVAIGTLRHVTPFEALLAWSEQWKESWDRPAERAPIPHAELLTLAALAEQGGVSLAAATGRLQAKGVRDFTGETVVRDIAERANQSARELYDIILNPGSDRASFASDGGALRGLGWKTLAQFCADEGIELAAALGRLKTDGVTADETLTLREIATASGRKPYELPGLIRGSAQP
jgi:hypothetical protein